MQLEKILNCIIKSGIYVLIIAIPLIIDRSFYSYKLLFLQFVGGFLLLILSIKIILKNSKDSFTLLLFPIILYLAANVFSYLISEYQNLSLFVLSKKFAFLSLFFIIIFNFPLRKISKLINIWIFTAAIVSIYGIFQFLGIDFLNLYKDWFKGYYQIFSTAGNPNFLAGYLAITFPFLISYVLTTKKKILKIVIPMMGLFMFTCLILTFSRSGYLAFIISIFIFIILYLIFKKVGNKSYPSSKIIFSLCMLIMVIIIISSTVLSYNPYLKYKIICMVTQRSARIHIWEGAIRMIAKKPLGGFGLGTFVVNFPDYRPKILLRFHPPKVAYIKHAHNHFLEVWTEAGLWGIFSFFVLILIPIFTGIKYILKKGIKYSKGLICISAVSSFIGMISINLVNVNMHYPIEGMFFWVLIGIIYLLIVDDFKLKRFKFKKFGILFFVMFILLSFVMFKEAFKSLPYIDRKNHNFDLIFQDFKHENINLENLKENDKFTPMDYYKLGNFYAKEKEWTKAIKYYNEAIKRRKNFISAYNNLGNSYYYDSKFKKTIQTYETALSIAENQTILYNLGTVYFCHGYIRQALDTMEKVLSINPNNYKARYLIYKLAK